MFLYIQLMYSNLMETHTHMYRHDFCAHDVPQLSEVICPLLGLCAAATCASTIFTCKIGMTYCCIMRKFLVGPNIDIQCMHTYIQTLHRCQKTDRVYHHHRRGNIGAIVVVFWAQTWHKYCSMITWQIERLFIPLKQWQIRPGVQNIQKETN